MKYSLEQRRGFMQELMCLKMGSQETVDDYIDRALTLSKRADDSMPYSDRITIFKRGLPRYILDGIRGRSYQGLEELTNLIRKVQIARFEEKEDVLKKELNDTITELHRKGNLITETLTRLKNGERRSALSKQSTCYGPHRERRIDCYICGNNHRMRDCPRNLRNQHNQVSVKSPVEEQDDDEHERPSICNMYFFPAPTKGATPERQSYDDESGLLNQGTAFNGRRSSAGSSNALNR